MDIEALAVAHLNTLLGRCAHLKAYITLNDKTPFTDGHIDLYNAVPQTKASWDGRVDVQVKGRSRASKKPLNKFPIDRTELLAFQKNSGVLYFVVTVNQNGHCAPYYALLSPFAIQALLDGAPTSKQQVPVPVQRLPVEPEDIEPIVSLAWKTKDQNVEKGFDSVLLERIESFSVYTSSALDFETPTTLTSGVNDFALVLHTVDGMSIPIGGDLSFVPPQYVETSYDRPISSGDVCYQQATIRRLDTESFVIRVGEELSLKFREAPGRLSATVDLTLVGSLFARLKAIRFYMSLTETKQLIINDHTIPLDIEIPADDGWLSNHLEIISAMDALFDKLGVDTRLIDLDQLDKSQARNLGILHRALVLGEEIPSENAETSRTLQQVGPWNLLLLVTPGSDPARWQVVDPFAIETRRQFQWAAGPTGEGATIPVTAYDIVDDEHVGSVLNMRLGSIVGAYEAISDVSTTFGLANERVLALLRAADTQGQRRDELLDAAHELNDWLIEEEGDLPHHLINRWQIIARRAELTDEQRIQIRGVKRNAAQNLTENPQEIEFACALLLDDHEEADYLLGYIPAARRELMLNWPIWALRSTDAIEST